MNFFEHKNIDKKFISLFTLYFFIGQIFLYATNFSQDSYLVNTLNPKISTNIINALFPHENLVAIEKGISSNNCTLLLTLGCDGLDGIMILLSAILAFSFQFYIKVILTFFSVIIMMLFNWVRIVLLYCTLRYIPEYFQIFHIYIGQTIMIFAGVGTFLLFTRNFSLNDG